MLLKKPFVLIIISLLILIGGFLLFKNIPSQNAPDQITPLQIQNSPADNNKNLTGKASLSWIANKEPDVAGYKIYYGFESRKGDCPNDGGYQNSVDIGNKTTYDFNSLEANKTYYFSITSYDKSNNESCFSEEVKKVIN